MPDDLTADPVSIRKRLSTETPPNVPPEPVNDPDTRDIVPAASRRAELSLNDSQIDMICAAAP